MNEDKIDTFIHIPEPHPLRAFCDENKLTIEQISKRILRSKDVTKKILDGYIEPTGAVRDRLNSILEDTELDMDYEE